MIASIVVLLVMVAINLAMVFAIVRLTSRVNDNVQKFFLDKTGKIFAVSESEEKPIETTTENVLNVPLETSSNVIVVNQDDNTKYKSKSFIDEYKQVKTEMDFDRQKVVLDVIEDDQDQNVSNDEYNSAIIAIANQFDFETIYTLSTISYDKQIEVLKEVFDEDQNKYFNHYLQSLNGRKFEATEFFNAVKETAKLIDENYYVKTGWDQESFDDLADNIVTIHDDSIVEGIKVVHKDKMYDYSI